MVSGKIHKEWAELFCNLLKKHLGDRLISVVLYGSVAVGREEPGSDVDLLIVLKGPLKGRFLRRQLLDPIYKEWDCIPGNETAPFISTLIKTPEEAKILSPLYFDMIDRRELLVDEEGFFKKILADTKKRLDRLGAQRKKIGKIEYWDLKPDYKPGEVFEI